MHQSAIDFQKVGQIGADPGLLIEHLLGVIARITLYQAIVGDVEELELLVLFQIAEKKVNFGGSHGIKRQVQLL